ncbi:MAG: dynamin family protein, partial [Oscillibacter sp.]|nr:dynamin family protein [Oscillibacter sp.]
NRAVQNSGDFEPPPGTSPESHVFCGYRGRVQARQKYADECSSGKLYYADLCAFNYSGYLRVTYGAEPRATILMKNGTVRQISVDELEPYVSRWSGNNETRVAEVKEAVIYCPCPFCQNGVELIDTPGLNWNSADKIVEDIIPELDVAVMALSATEPISQMDLFVNELCHNSAVKELFALTRMDNIKDEPEWEKIPKYVSQRIAYGLLNRVEMIYGKDSDEYRNAERECGQIEIYPLSALQALRGKEQRNQQLVEQSGILAFEERLWRILTKEREILVLNAALKTMKRATEEIERLHRQGD